MEEEMTDDEYYKALRKSQLFDEVNDKIVKIAKVNNDEEVEGKIKKMFEVIISNPEDRKAEAYLKSLAEIKKLMREYRIAKNKIDEEKFEPIIRVTK